MPTKSLTKPRTAKTVAAPKAAKTVTRVVVKKKAATKPVAEKKAKPVVAAKTEAAVPVPSKAPATAPAPVAVASVQVEPTFDQIARRAYKIYAGRGMAPGRENEDWAQAERELRAEAAKNN